jgi:hypothetical protein
MSNSKRFIGLPFLRKVVKKVYLRISVGAGGANGLNPAMAEGYTANKKKARSKSVEKINGGRFFKLRLLNPRWYTDLRKRVCDEE